jgi:hypothetical protein
MQPAYGTNAGSATGVSYLPSLAAAHNDVTLNDLHQESGDPAGTARQVPSRAGGRPARACP